MTVHAFVDESERNGCYILCAALAAPKTLTPTRKQLSRLLLPGQRELHFKREGCARQRMLADQIARLPVSVSLYHTPSTRRTAEKSRQRCMARLMRDLCELRAHRLVLDTREVRDRHDLETIHKALGDDPWRDEFTYEHLPSQREPLTWIADAAGWCYGAGGDWRRRITPIIRNVIEA